MKGVNDFMQKKERQKESGSFFKTWFPALTTTILTCLTSVLVAYMTLLANGKTIPIPSKFKGFSVPFEVQFGITLFLTLFFVYLTLSSARKVLLRYRDSKQEHLSFSSRSGNVMSEIMFLDSSQNYFLFETGVDIDPNLHVSYISNPQCSKQNMKNPNDNHNGEELDNRIKGFEVCHTELKCSKTFLGRYIYTCDRCNNRMKSNYSLHTLRSKAARVVLSEVRQRIKSGEIKVHDEFLRRRF